VRREQFFRLRLDDEEQERLTEEAKAAGLTKADLIRAALGWKTHSPPSLPPVEAKKLVAGVAEAAPADPESEPHKHALEQLAKRIHGRDGVPMKVARQRAKEEGVSE